MDPDPRLAQIDVALLTPLVRRALNRETAAIRDWSWAPIAYDMYLAGRTLARFAGHAQVDGETVPWSFVLKLLPPTQGTSATGYGAPQREALAYTSGLLSDLPGGLTAPRALAVTEDADGAEWLWLEDVADSYDHRWPIAQFQTAAYHLGRFNGAYLTARALPTFPWLMPNWAEWQSPPAHTAAVLPEI